MTSDAAAPTSTLTVYYRDDPPETFTAVRRYRLADGHLHITVATGPQPTPKPLREVDGWSVVLQPPGCASPPSEHHSPSDLHE